MIKKMLLTLSLAALCAAFVLPSLAEQSQRSATDYTFDGIQVGANFKQAALSKAPYQTPCDDDPIENKKRTIVVYMGQECRGKTFPQKTTVLFFLDHALGDTKFAQPIQAIAWVGGTYFNGKAHTNFPAQMGQVPSVVAKTLGRSTTSFRIGGDKRFVTVRKHPGDVYSLSYKSRAVAFIVGQMPEKQDAESWEAMLEMIGSSMRRR